LHWRARPYRHFARQRNTGHIAPRPAIRRIGEGLTPGTRDRVRRVPRGSVLAFSIAVVVARPGDVARLLGRSFYLPFAGWEARAALRESARRRVEAYVRWYGDELLRTIRPEARFEVPLAAARVRGRIDLLLRAEENGNGS